MTPAPLLSFLWYCFDTWNKEIYQWGYNKETCTSIKVHKTTNKSTRSACMDLGGVNFHLIKPTYKFLVIQTYRMRSMLTFYSSRKCMECHLTINYHLQALGPFHPMAKSKVTIQCHLDIYAISKLTVRLIQNQCTIFPQEKILLRAKGCAK